MRELSCSLLALIVGFSSLFVLTNTHQTVLGLPGLNLLGGRGYIQTYIRSKLRRKGKPNLTAQKLANHVSKKLGVSQTAIEIINGRWTMHIFGLRDDHAAAKLNPVLPNNSTFGLWLALTPLYVYYRISGSTKWYPVIAKAGEEGLARFRR